MGGFQIYRDDGPQRVGGSILFSGVAQSPTRNMGKIHHFSWENPLFLWPFSIAMLVHQRVSFCWHLLAMAPSIFMGKDSITLRDPLIHGCTRGGGRTPPGPESDFATGAGWNMVAVRKQT